MENNIIQQALDALQKEAPVTPHWHEEHNGEDYGIDGTLDIVFENGEERFLVQCKQNIRPPQIAYLKNLNEQNNHFMIIANYILPKAKEELRHLGIAYLDTAGNIFLQTKKHFLLIEGKRPKIKTDDELKNRAFTKTGLKIVYNLLGREELINETYRYIARKTDVGLDTINKTFTALRTLGHLVNIDEHRQKLVKTKELYNRWINAYETKLRPALFIGNFRFLKDEDERNWKGIHLKNQHTYWGGEPSADLYTDFLRPAIFTIYTDETRIDLMKNYRLIPDDNGNVKIYKKFWSVEEVNENVTHPLLVYADLINNRDPRNIEVAQKIYDDFLKDRLT
ncbi:MAG TPA: type IV toxin-antitoxin system AbiEi family antitoxin [Bacteroidia bacterium]|nr:type IV toxin-antitoxin system AbiEi family antitoxin [Bacteroidia bacterium]